MKNRTRILSAFALSFGLLAVTGCAQTKAVTQGVKIVGDHIELEDHIHFETGKADIKADSHDLLNRLAMVLEHNADIATVNIHGHTDKSGDPAMNQTLSEARANSVKAYLESKGVQKNLVTKGFGQDKPICTEETPECQSKNRRVEFLIERS